MYQQIKVKQNNVKYQRMTSFPNCVVKIKSVSREWKDIAWGGDDIKKKKLST